jgi:chromosome segregation ATPase
MAKTPAISICEMMRRQLKAEEKQLKDLQSKISVKSGELAQAQQKVPPNQELIWSLKQWLKDLEADQESTKTDIEFLKQDILTNCSPQ